ncbi:hypothetical protein GE21DRAFT_8943, partial [Neurospora crassa]
MEMIAVYGLLRAVDRPHPSTYLGIISTFILLYTIGSSEKYSAVHVPLWRQTEAYKMEWHQMVGDAQSPKIDQGPTSMLQCPKPARVARPAIRKSCQKRSPHQDYRFHLFLVVVEF